MNNFTTINELVNEYHQPVLAPNTFHLERLLNLSDKTIHSEEDEWTKEFLNSENDKFLWNEQNSM